VLALAREDEVTLKFPELLHVAVQGRRKVQQTVSQQQCGGVESVCGHRFIYTVRRSGKLDDAATVIEAMQQEQSTRAWLAACGLCTLHRQIAPAAQDRVAITVASIQV